MNERATVRDGAIRIERLLPGPIERVWAYLVDPDKRSLWFAGGSFEPRAGGKGQFEFDHRRLSHEPKGPEDLSNYGVGWHAHLDTLQDRLEGVKPRGFWTNFARLQKGYAQPS